MGYAARSFFTFPLPCCLDHSVTADLDSVKTKVTSVFAAKKAWSEYALPVGRDRIALPTAEQHRHRADLARKLPGSFADRDDLDG